MTLPMEAPGNKRTRVVSIHWFVHFSMRVHIVCVFLNNIRSVSSLSGISHRRTTAADAARGNVWNRLIPASGGFCRVVWSRANWSSSAYWTRAGQNCSWRMMDRHTPVILAVLFCWALIWAGQSSARSPDALPSAAEDECKFFFFSFFLLLSPVVYSRLLIWRRRLLLSPPFPCRDENAATLVPTLALVISDQRRFWHVARFIPLGEALRCADRGGGCQSIRHLLSFLRNSAIKIKSKGRPWIIRGFFARASKK